MSDLAVNAPDPAALRAAHESPSGAAPVGGEHRLRDVYGRRDPGRWALRHPVAALLGVLAIGYALGRWLRVAVLPDPSCTEPARG